MCYICWLFPTALVQEMEKDIYLIYLSPGKAQAHFSSPAVQFFNHCTTNYWSESELLLLGRQLHARLLHPCKWSNESAAVSQVLSVSAGPSSNEPWASAGLGGDGQRYLSWAECIRWTIHPARLFPPEQTANPGCGQDGKAFSRLSAQYHWAPRCSDQAPLLNQTFHIVCSPSQGCLVQNK